jgi:hypothetical protein
MTKSRSRGVLDRPVKPDDDSVSAIVLQRPARANVAADRRRRVLTAVAWSMQMPGEKVRLDANADNAGKE